MALKDLIELTLNMDSHSSWTVLPKSGPPSVLEASEDRVLTDSCSFFRRRGFRMSRRSFRLRDVVMGRGLKGLAWRSRQRWGPTLP